MVAPAHNFDPKILREGSAKLRWAGPRDLIFHSLCSLRVVQWSEKSIWRGRPKLDRFLYIYGGRMRSNEAGKGGGARSAPFGVAMSSTGAHARPKSTSRLNMELNLQSLFGLLCTAVLLRWGPATPPSPRIWAHIRGRYWSAKIDDISL